eukprot:11176229-Lingulodinium_polyedra.AAC.1
MLGPTIVEQVLHGVCSFLVEGRSIPGAIVKVEDNCHEDDEGPGAALPKGELQVVPAAVGGVGEVHDAPTSDIQEVPIALVPPPSLVAGHNQEWWWSRQGQEVLSQGCQWQSPAWVPLLAQEPDQTHACQ